MSKYETIQKYCKLRGTSVAKMERDLNFARGSIAKIDEHKPSANKIWRICDYLRMPMNLLMDINEEHMRLMEQFDELTEKPLYRASAGQGAYNSTYADETINVPSDDGYEYATVIGDSMFPLLHDKDVVIIQPQSETTKTDLSLVKVDGEHATVKYVEVVENGLWLRAENKEVFEDKFYSVQEIINLPIKVIGKVIELRRKI